MTTFLFILAFIAVFVLGVVSAILLIAVVVKHDADTNEGVWLSYNRKQDVWKCFGDLPAVYAKAQTHYKQIEKVC